MLKSKLIALKAHENKVLLPRFFLLRTGLYFELIKEERCLKRTCSSYVMELEFLVCRYVIRISRPPMISQMVALQALAYKQLLDSLLLLRIIIKYLRTVAL